MPALDLSINDAALIAKIKAVGNLDKTAIYRAVAAGLQTLIELTFKRGVDPWGKPWKPLSPWSRSGQPLRDTGRLLSSITPRADDSGVTVGPSVSYAAIHQFGGVIVPKTKKVLSWQVRGGHRYFSKKSVIPARAFLPLTDPSTLLLPAAWETLLLNRMATAIEQQLEA
jgi:phage gpG-like protein